VYYLVAVACFVQKKKKKEEKKITNCIFIDMPGVCVQT